MRNTLIISITILLVSCGVKEQTISKMNIAKSNALFHETQLLIKNKQWKKAEQNLTVLISVSPKNADYYMLRGYVRTMDLRYEDCIVDFTRAITLKPRINAARTNRGFAYREIGEYQKAIDDFTAELKINPNAYSYEHRSIVYYLNKNYDKAIKDVNISIEKAPENSISYKTRALINKAKRSKEKACSDKEKALELRLLEKYPQYKTDIEELNEYCSE